MTPTFQNFCQVLLESIQLQQGLSLAQLLSLKNSYDYYGMSPVPDPEAVCLSLLPASWRSIAAAYVKGINFYWQRDYLSAFKVQCSLIDDGVIKLLQSQPDDNHCMPLLLSTCSDLLKLTKLSEQQLVAKCTPSHGSIFKMAADVLLNCFRLCATDNFSSAFQTSKKIGMLHIVNLLFKIYFNLNLLSLCVPLIKAVENTKFLDLFPISQKVTYKYFLGRKALFDGEYDKSEKCLEYAFLHCHARCRKNKRLILIYLIPIKLLLGYMPQESLLLRYDLLPFSEISASVRSGNVGRLEACRHKFRAFFIKYEIFLFLQKLVNLTARNLFKKVYLILDSHQVSIASLLKALHFVNYSLQDDIDDVECLLCNLIFDGNIKGYISHQHGKLVVSKINAFPKLLSLKSSAL